MRRSHPLFHRLTRLLDGTLKQTLGIKDNDTRRVDCVRAAAHVGQPEAARAIPQAR